MQLQDQDAEIIKLVSTLDRSAEAVDEKYIVSLSVDACQSPDF